MMTAVRHLLAASGADERGREPRFDPAVVSRLFFTLESRRAVAGRHRRITASQESASHHAITPIPLIETAMMYSKAVTQFSLPVNAGVR